MFLGPMEKRTVRFDITFLSWGEVNTCSKKRKNPAQSCQVSVERPRVVTLEGEVIAPNGNMSSALRSSCCLWLWHGPRKFRRKSGVAALKLVVSVLERVNGTAKLFAQNEVAAALRSFFKEGVDGGGRKHTITIICSNRGHEFARCEELKRRKGGVWRCRAASRNANKGEHI